MSALDPESMALGEIDEICESFTDCISCLEYGIIDEFNDSLIECIWNGNGKCFHWTYNIDNTTNEDVNNQTIDSITRCYGKATQVEIPSGKSVDNVYPLIPPSIILLMGVMLLLLIWGISIYVKSKWCKQTCIDEEEEEEMFYSHYL